MKTKMEDDKFERKKVGRDYKRRKGGTKLKFCMSYVIQCN